MKHELPELPYSLNALQPVISQETLEFHHGKHHRAYVNKLNELIAGTEFEKMPLLEVVLRSSGPIFNNAAQAWNHAFYWNSLSPDKIALSKGSPLEAAITRDFGSKDKLEADLKKAAAGQFGSGWAWLVAQPDPAGKAGKLAIVTTSNAENPLRSQQVPLLTVDVWEHAYYIDYRNDRAKYLDGIPTLLNWDFALRNYLEGGSALRA